MCGVTRWDRIRNEEIRRRTGVLLELSKIAEQKRVEVVWTRGKDGGGQDGQENHRVEN